MGSAILQEGRFNDAQESRFKAANRSNMGNAVLQEERLATAQESRFQAAKRSDMRSASCKKVDLLMFRNRVFRMRKLIYGQCWAAMRLIC